MTLNDTTNEQGLYQDALYLTGANTATFTIKDFTRLANQAQNRVVSLIQENDRRWKWADSNNGTRDIGVTNIVSGQDNYTMEVYHLKIREIRVLNKNGEWKTLTSKDRRLMTDTEKNASGEPESYDVDGNSLMLYPTPDYSATSGLEIHYQGTPDDFEATDTTKEPGFCPLFHRLVSLYPSQDWLLANSTAQNPMTHKINNVENLINKMEYSLVEHYRSRDEDEAPKFYLKRTYRNNGLNL